MRKYYVYFTLSLALLLPQYTNAFNGGNYYAGFGYYSENAINETAQKPDASSGFLGEASFPFVFEYDYAFIPGWFLAPQLNYNLLPRKTKGDTAEVTITQINLGFGANTATSGLDWSVGPTYFRETIKGKGGTVVMNNGTSNATFGLPGRSSTIQKLGLNLATGYTTGKYRFGFDLLLLAPFSSKERTQNLMISVTYQIGGSGGGGSSGGMRF